MRVTIVQASRFGTTARLAHAMAEAIAPLHAVEVLGAAEAAAHDGRGTDLLVVGGPTELRGHLLPARAFLDALGRHGWEGCSAAAFDTRYAGDPGRTGSAAAGIARRLSAAGCNLVAPAESFIVGGIGGPLAAGEEARARTWIRDICRSATTERVPAGTVPDARGARL